jgi:hypothetical protein
MKVQVQLIKDYNTAAEAIKGMERVVSVETEYGEQFLGTKDGCAMEMVHHGVNAGNPAPSDYWMRVINGAECNFKTFIISHIDADTIFGIGFASGILNSYCQRTQEIAKLVSYTDINGLHATFKNFYNDNMISTDIRDAHLGVGYLVNKIKYQEDRDAKVNDASEFISGLLVKIRDFIKNQDQSLVENTWAWIESQRKVARNAWVDNERLTGPFINAFVSDVFMGTNYNIYDCDDKLIRSSDVVVSFNTQYNSISIFVTDEKIAVELFGERGVVEILQSYFGEDAGGRVSVGGSPRGVRFKLADFYKFVKKVRKHLESK